VQDPVELTVHIRDSGRELTENAIVGLFMVPIIFTIVFFMAMQTTSTYLMSSVAEEKTNRIMEILVTSVTPFQLLLGKIIGLGTLGLTQLAIWLVGGVVLLSVGQQSPFLAGVTLPLDLVLLALVYFVITYFLYAGIMAGIGASAGSEQESRQIAGLVTVIGVIPFFFFALFLTDPQNLLITIMTLVPFTAPLTVLLRSSLGSVPTIELIASLIILLVSAVFAVWASARVFRWSSLLYGQRATPRQIWRVIRGQNEANVGTVAAHHEEQVA
ncbi:MAG: ABC transporter permease, partial [Anaerolineae bacterium]|nr:ABC transporter permease [Anaerolineae bacterium]